MDLSEQKTTRRYFKQLEKEREKVEKQSRQSTSEVDESNLGDNKEQGMELGKRKRGRKLTEASIYYQASKSNIDEWQKELNSGKNKTTGKDLTAKEKQKLRNRISALKSRMSKKSELSDLEANRDLYRKRFTILIKHVYNELTVPQRDKICGLLPQMLENEDGGDLDQHQPSRLTRQKSKNDNGEKYYFKFKLNEFLGFQSNK